MTTFSASLTNRKVLLPQARDSSHHVTKAKRPPRPRSSGIPGVTWRHPTRVLATDVSQTVTGSATILAPPPIRLQKHPDLRTHDFAHSPYMWHEPRLANCNCLKPETLWNHSNRSFCNDYIVKGESFMLWRNLYSRVMFVCTAHWVSVLNTQTHPPIHQRAHADTCKTYHTAYKTVSLRMNPRGSKHVGDIGN